MMLDIEEKRNEIRGGIEQILDLYIDEGLEEERLIKRADKILRYLHSQGVVIADRDRGLPEVKVDFGDGSYEILTNIIGHKYNQAGYVATIPLVKD